MHQQGRLINPTAVEEAFDKPERSRKPTEPTDVDKAFDSGSKAGGYDPLKNTNPAVEEAFDKPEKSRKQGDDRSYVDKAFDDAPRK